MSLNNAAEPFFMTSLTVGPLTSQGKEIIEHFIGQLKEEGITHVAPFEPAGTTVPAVTVTDDDAQR